MPDGCDRYNAVHRVTLTSSCGARIETQHICEQRERETEEHDHYGSDHHSKDHASDAYRC
jgi:hypothetical protein